MQKNEFDGAAGWQEIENIPSQITVCLPCFQIL